MVSDLLDTRYLPIVALLALLPVLAYGLLKDPVVALSVLSVLIIVASLLFMFLPSEATARSMLQRRA
ncbi:MAG: hypothetical protein ABEJ61_01700 [Haloferacaceae archaeon]